MDKSYTDKDFFKELQKEIKDYADDIPVGFPYFCLKVFFDWLSKDAIESALTGLDTNDDSIDAFFIDEENKDIYIIQCKSVLSEKRIQAAKKEWFSYLDDADNKLKNNDYIDNHKNNRLKEIASEYIIASNKGFKTKKIIFHLGHCPSNTLEPFREKIQYYGIKKIKDEYLEYLSKLDRTEPSHIEISLSEDSIQPNNIANKHNTFISIITGEEIIKLREKHRYKLFDKNLRFGLGQNKINKGIVETANNAPENFYFYNNGITITSKRFKLNNNNRLKIEFPQIINGAQTVNSLYEAFKEQKNKEIRKSISEEEGTEKAQKHFDKIKVLFRIIQDSEKDGKKNSDFENNVIRYNNSQNSVRESDFYSNHEEQIELQRLFAELGYFYEIKRGDRKYLDIAKEEHTLLKKKKGDFPFWDKKIDMENLASIWMAYSSDPTTRSVQKAQIFGYAGDRYYDTIFPKKENLSIGMAKEMVLAFNLFEIIVSQTEIYGNTKKKGQIISKISQFKEGNKEEFDNIKEIINNALFLGSQIKKQSEDIDTFFKEKDDTLNFIKKYHFFSMGRYFTLAIFQEIIAKCEYKKTLLENDLFLKEEFLRKNIVSKWLKTILDKVLKEEISNFEKEVGSSIKTFYSRSDIWDKIRKRLRALNLEEDKDFKDIFPMM